MRIVALGTVPVETWIVIAGLYDDAGLHMAFVMGHNYDEQGRSCVMVMDIPHAKYLLSPLTDVVIQN
jgi:hypothetical protein